MTADASGPQEGVRRRAIGRKARGRTDQDLSSSPTLRKLASMYIGRLVAGQKCIALLLAEAFLRIRSVGLLMYRRYEWGGGQGSPRAA